MPDLALVIFDLDGTLVDSRALIVLAMSRAAEQAGVPVPQEAAVAAIIGLNLSGAIGRLFPDQDPPAHALIETAYRDIFVELRQGPGEPEPLFLGARDVVSDLRAAGTLLGIATGKARRGVNHILERHDMAGWFETIQTPDTNPSKPHPAMIDAAMRETGADRHKTVMIGDTGFDMEMARNAGVAAIGVAWGNHEPDELKAAGAHMLVEQVSALPQAITKALAGDLK